MVHKRRQSPIEGRAFHDKTKKREKVKREGEKVMPNSGPRTTICRVEKGFTLWELLIILSLMGFLLSVLIPHFSTSIQPVQERIQQANIRKIEGAIQLYKLDVGSLPTKLEDLIKLPAGVTGWQGPYLKAWPVNPWDPEKVYKFDRYGQVIMSP